MDLLGLSYLIFFMHSLEVFKIAFYIPAMLSLILLFIYLFIIISYLSCFAYCLLFFLNFAYCLLVLNLHIFYWFCNSKLLSSWLDILLCLNFCLLDIPRIRFVPILDICRCLTHMITLNYVIFLNYCRCRHARIMSDVLYVFHKFFFFFLKKLCFISWWYPSCVILFKKIHDWFFLIFC
jgi:hypothetical protein